jgi:hypothetical protein
MNDQAMLERIKSGHRGRIGSPLQRQKLPAGCAGPDDVLRLAGDDVTGVGLWASMEIGFRAGVSDLLTLDRVQSIRPYLKSMC